MKKAIKSVLQLQKLSFLSQNTYDINKSEYMFLFFVFFVKEKLGVQNRMWEGGIWDTASTTTGTAGVGHDWKRADG